jgi:CBS domain-containing protein
VARCPSCEHENVPGVDICESCGWDLLDSGVPAPTRGIQAKILAAPLVDLEPAPIVAVERDTPLEEALKRMRDERHGSVLVLEGGEIAGIFTERDVLMKVVGRKVDVATTPVGDVMTAGPDVLRASDPLAYAIHLMAVRGFRHIPVIRGGRPLGIVSIRGVIGYLTKQAL